MVSKSTPSSSPAALRPRQRQAVDGDGLDAAAGVVRRHRAARQQPRGDALRLGLHGGRRVGEQLALAVEDLLDALAQQRPAVAFDVEVAAEVEQRALADAAAVAFGADEAVGVVDGAVGGAGPGASDEPWSCAVTGSVLARLASSAAMGRPWRAQST